MAFFGVVPLLATGLCKRVLVFVLAVTTGLPVVCMCGQCLPFLVKGRG